MNIDLTIGFAVYDDAKGTAFTIQGLRTTHADAMRRCEIVAVDNHPGGPDSHQLVALCEKTGTRYVPMATPTGTAAPRNRVFDEARGKVVMVLDCHVLLVPGAVQAVLDHFDQHPDSRDLLSGPMLFDDLEPHNAATHFADVWRDQMWGVWDTAWRCDCGQAVALVQLPPDGPGVPGSVTLGRVGYATLTTNPQPLMKCPRCRKTLPPAEFADRFQRLPMSGLRPAIDDPTPFEIPGQGLGLFACRRSAWPGFSPHFRGFGGEEMYIHERIRRAGGRNLCLPAVRWWHWFGTVNQANNPNQRPYPVTLWSKLRNYVIGHRELGLSLDRLREHFAAVTPAGWWDVLTATFPPQEEIGPSVVTGAPVAANGKAGCGSCQQARPRSLEDWYAQARDTKGDINEHVPTLRELAAKCQHVTEFGVRQGVSTVALLAGQPKRLISYDLRPSTDAQFLQGLAGSCAFEFRQGDSRNVQIEPTDMLFVDTTHTGQHLMAELTNAAPKVGRWIVLHDTVVFGEVGEDGTPGLMPAVRSFLGAHRDWTVIRHDLHNNGLMVLSRDDADKQQPPSLLRKAVNFAKALAEHAKDGNRLVDDKDWNARLDQCLTCPHRWYDMCGLCGCPCDRKASWASSECPDSPRRWGKVELPMVEGAA